MPARALKMLMTQSPVGAIVGKIPGVAAAYKSYVWRHPHFMNSFYGTYASYDDAAAAAFDDRVLGWDTDAVTAAENHAPSMFASLFWLSRVIGPGSTVVDFGGAMGLLAREFCARQPLPEGAEWVVIDLPAVVARAQKLPPDQQLPQLRFSSDLDALSTVDVFFSAGSIQYLNKTTDEIVAMITRLKPRHVVLNSFALISRPGFWTLQHLGDAMSPNQIFAERDVFAAFYAAGYVLRDRWEVAELNCQVPFQPARYVPRFSGIYMERVA